jgi:hypothetical protein
VILGHGGLLFFIEPFDNKSVRDLVVSLRRFNTSRKAEDMERTNPSRWVRADEASALLQRFMPSKQASAWLETDRKVDPKIPFYFSQGNVVYQSRDLEQFVRHCLAPNSQVDFSERRARSDRRRATDRRHNAEVRLSAVAERRRAHSIDRRGSRALDRRSQM